MRAAPPAGCPPPLPAAEEGRPLRVLLVYHNPSRVTLPAPPVGLAYVATATRAAGHRVAFLDLSRERRPLPRLAAALAAQRPEVVGFSVRNLDNVVRQRLESDLEAQRALTAMAREAGARVVVGGPAVSLLGARSLDRLGADYAVLGEGEEAFPALLAALAAGRPPETVPGVRCREPGAALRQVAPSRLASFGPSGMEDWVDWRPYARAGHTWPIQTRRGCPLACSYCTYPALEGQRVRRRAPEEVADEIARVQRRWHPRAFEVVDSTFNVPAGPALELCATLRRRRLGARLTTMGLNPRGTTSELFTAMREAGFHAVMIGAESAADPMLASLGKGFTAADVARTAQLARRSRLACAWFFLLGGPGETPATVEETLRFVEREIPRDQLCIVFTGIRLLPGTLLAAAETAAGRLEPDADPAEPRFYLSPDVDERWVLAAVNATVGRCPNVVHAAEGITSRWQRLLERTWHLLGLAPPYWRFTPRYLALPPVAWLRTRFPEVGERPLPPRGAAPAA